MDRLPLEAELGARSPRDGEGASMAPSFINSRGACALFQEALRFGGQGPEMAALPGGRFLMGSPEGVGEDSERPQHAVAVPAFAIGRFPITFDDYDAYCAATGAARLGDEGWGRERRPAIGLAWADAQGYCTWLSGEIGGAYRLPSEAEWEYACRAGSTTQWSFGDSEAELGAHAWFAANSGEQTHPVGEKQANAFGLFDMHGHVWEWCADAWRASYHGAPGDASAWEGRPASAAVLRGGAWSSSAQTLRSAHRFAGQRDYRGRTFGVRVARTIHN